MYGFLDNDAVSASFALDGGAAVTRNVDKPPSAVFDWPFFSTSPPLTDGLHELTVTVNSGTFNLDYFVYTTTGHDVNTGDVSRVETVPTAVSASATATPSSDDSPSITSSKQAVSPAAIAGISVAGALVILLIGLQQWCSRRGKGRRVRHRRADPEKPVELIDDCTICFVSSL